MMRVAISSNLHSGTLPFNTLWVRLGSQKLMPRPSIPLGLVSLRIVASIPASAESTPLCWLPIRDNEALEAHLALQNVVQQVIVLTRLRVVNLVVSTPHQLLFLSPVVEDSRAHDCSHAVVHCIIPRPQVQLMQGPVVDVRGIRLGSVKIYARGRPVAVPLDHLTIVFLFVQSEVLADGDGAPSMHTMRPKPTPDKYGSGEKPSQMRPPSGARPSGPTTGE